MNKINKINGIWDSISESLKKIETLHSNPQINSFHQSLNSVNTNFNSTIENMKKRQLLIDIQCASMQFGGFLHENYHLVNIEIDTNLNNLFSSIKTSLNRLASLFCSLVSHEEKSKISDRSFGTLLNSLDKKIFKDRGLEEMRKILVSKGREIDKMINDYRDDHIEHVRNPTHGLLSSTPSSLNRFHTPIKPTEQAPDNKHETRAKWPATKLVMENGEYLYYVHVEPNQDNSAQVEKGMNFGLASDGNTGHFEKYGPHIHIFSSQNTHIELPTEVSAVSPELYSSIEVFTELIHLFTQQLLSVYKVIE